ncbi:MAG: BrnT family toxin [Myxococcales bacterium]|nr:BrnT family toxin [Myxococcales bacterium]
MRFDWDPHKDEANQRKHGIGFAEASALFTSGVEFLEIFDEAHSHQEDRFIAVGPIGRGVVVVVWTEQPPGTIRIISARRATAREAESFRRSVESSP